MVYGGDVSGKLAAALYDNNGKLIETKLYNAAKTVPVELKNSVSGGKVRFMWFSGTDSIKPLCESLAIDI